MVKRLMSRFDNVGTFAASIIFILFFLIKLAPLYCSNYFET